MERTIYETWYSCVTLEDLAGVERNMSKDELNEMNKKIQSLMSTILGIPDVQTRALMEQSFKRGYLTAHIKLGNN